MRLRKKNHTLAGFDLPRDQAIAGRKVRLRRKKIDDAHDDYSWQSDAEMARLDAAPALDISFPIYLLDYAYQLRNSGINRYLAIDTLEGRHIGNCTYYDVDEDRDEAQVGIMIGDRDYWDRGYGTDAVTTLVDHIFLRTGLRRIYLKTLDWNRRAQQCFKKCGFAPCGQLSKNGYSFIVMEITRPQWEEQRKNPGRTNDNPERGV